VNLAAAQRRVPVRARAHAPVILCADDYAISDGVSRGIEDLARAGRLSATSALVTTSHWREGARRLAPLRPRLAVGLHLNLTMGRPLGPMPVLAPSGAFMGLARLLNLALTGRLAKGEIGAEVARQVARFEEHAGYPPDFVDGHQHVHAFPGVRAAVLAALGVRFGRHQPLLRDPGDSPRAILAREAAVAKAMGVALLTFGFRAAARRRGFPTNEGFSGFSGFDRARSYAEELACFFRRPGPRHLIMCHPGYPDDDLAGVDPVVGRRGDELDALLASPQIERMIWHPEREAEGLLQWPGEAGP